MLEVKVKTLDGRTHEFSVPDNTTVNQFKEIIRVKMDIAVDRQRLLFQGRVLQDENILSSYGVAGNVMHLVTRLPPQARPANDVTTEREENSDINRDQIRNILSDVFSNIGDLNNPMGVSVNNEGNRMDITVNIPSQNRLSLSRLRQNYVMRLLVQARSVINHMEDPSAAAPRADRDRLRQVDPYDIGPNDERLTDVTSQPLPINYLADMITTARGLWASAEPQLDLWESVLRRDTALGEISRSESESQRIHDSASRYVHLFSHVLHILSDYLVEFQQGTASRANVPAANGQTTTIVNDAATSVSIDEHNSPLTGAFGESGMAHSESVATNETNSTTNATAQDAPIEISDRSRYLYVFSEMPAQLVQVRLDMDSNISNLRTAAPVSTSTEPQTNVPVQPTTDSTTSAEAATERPADAAPSTTDTPDTRARLRRRFQANGNTVENLFRTTIQDTLIGSTNARPQMSTGTRSIRSTPQFMDNVDPYVRCQSRHFQHPSNLRSGAVISTISGIRLRDSSRTRPRNTETTPTSTANSTTTPMTNVRSQSNEIDPMGTLISGLMRSIFPGSNDVSRSTTTEQVNVGVAATQPVPTDIHRIIQSLSSGSNFNSPLSQIFPDMMNSQDMDPDNFVTNQIIQIVISRLTLTDFMSIVSGHYNSLNQLRLPLQEILATHQREAGSRDVLVDHVVSDLEFFNRAYISVFDRLRSGAPVENLSDEARSNFNIRLDIFRTINNLNRHHFQSMIDMIMRSPTNQGFGQLLMTSLTSHHDESLALIDIICNNNDELRRFLIKSFMDSLLASMNSSTDANSPSMNTLGLDLILGDINSGLFRRPELLLELKEHAMTHFVVYLSENGIGATSESVDGSIGNVDSIEDMVTNLSENIINGTILTEIDKPLAACTNGVVNEFMETCGRQQGEGPMSILNGAANWQGVLPQEWMQVISRDSAAALDGQAVPYSDAYVSGMPPKRRKVIMSQRQRAVQPAMEMMNDCIDQAIIGTGLSEPTHPRTFPTSLNDAFHEMVTERVGGRLAEERSNFPSERYPSVEENFNRKKRTEEDKKNN